MASGTTANFGLNQWAAEDSVLRAEFNRDNQKVEAALVGLSRPMFAAGIVAGYDGTADKTVELGRQPAMVMVGNRLGWTNIIQTNGSYNHPGHAVALPGHPGYLSGITSNEGTVVALEVTATGFTVRKGFDGALAPYRYLALFNQEL